MTQITALHPYGGPSQTYTFAPKSPTAEVPPTQGHVAIDDSACFGVTLTDSALYNVTTGDSSRYGLTISDEATYNVTASDTALWGLTIDDEGDPNG